MLILFCITIRCKQYVISLFLLVLSTVWMSNGKLSAQSQTCTHFPTFSLHDILLLPNLEWTEEDPNPSPVYPWYYLCTGHCTWHLFCCTILWRWVISAALFEKTANDLLSQVITYNTQLDQCLLTKQPVVTKAFWGFLVSSRWTESPHAFSIFSQFAFDILAIYVGLTNSFDKPYC
jgi:hypothetical protein